MGLPDPEAINALNPAPDGDAAGRKIKIVLYGEEVIEKTVASSGACGRVYLPREWLGKAVKIIRME